jgi:hypothetical protein
MRGALAENVEREGEGRGGGSAEKPPRGEPAVLERCTREEEAAAASEHWRASEC